VPSLSATETAVAPEAVRAKPRPGSVTLLVPTLNESDGMREMMPRIDRSMFDQILVVDGGSSDQTVEYAREQGFEVVIQRRRGMHYAYSEAFPHVTSEFVLTFSPDGNSVPELIPELIERARLGYDMVIASRYLPPARSYDDDWVTRFGNWMFTAYINVFFGGRYTDALVIYRIYRPAMFFELDLDKDESYVAERWCDTVIAAEPLMSLRAAKRRLRVSEIPGDEPKRLWGRRKLKIIRWGSAYALQMLRELWYWR
jgi:glycosyltransferase involved in cell wall biosynthesis